MGSPHLIPQVSRPQPSTALSNSTTGSASAPLMSSASESLAEVSSSTESTSSLSLPKSLIPDARHAHNTALPVQVFRSETDFLFRNTTRSSTSTRSPFLMETKDTFTKVAGTNSPSAAAADEDALQIPVTLSSQHSVALNRTFVEDLTDGAYQTNDTRLPAASARTLLISDGIPVARSAQLPFTGGVTKMSMD